MKRFQIGTRLMIASLVVVAEGCVAETTGGDDLSDGVLGEALRGGSNGCTVEPSPVTVDADYTVSLGGLRQGTEVRLDLTDGGGTRTFVVRADAARSVRVTTHSSVPGPAAAFFYRTGRHDQLRASCSFEVTAPCTPTTCEAAGAACGTAPDGCGGTLDCGGCTAPETCGGGGVPHRCGGGGTPCSPIDCATAGVECGAAADGCGGTLDCGGCTAPETCGGGGVPSRCGGGSSWSDEWAAFEARVLELVNERRAAGATCGSTSFAPAAPLTMHAAVRDAARLHSLDMGEQDYFSHTSLDGRSFLQRMLDAGFSGSCPCGENIAAGFGTPESVVAAWMASPGHCGNIMAAGYGVIGVGYASVPGSTYSAYWTLDFAAR